MSWHVMKGFSSVLNVFIWIPNGWLPCEYSIPFLYLKEKESKEWEHGSRSYRIRQNRQKLDRFMVLLEYCVWIYDTGRPSWKSAGIYQSKDKATVVRLMKPKNKKQQNEKQNSVQVSPPPNPCKYILLLFIVYYCFPLWKVLNHTKCMLQFWKFATALSILTRYKLWNEMNFFSKTTCASTLELSPSNCLVLPKIAWP